MKGLERFAIKFGDLFRSMNDNCTTAIKIGRLIVGGGRATMAKIAKDIPDGQCDMHLVTSATGLDLSFVERKLNGKVINYWAPFRDMYKLLLNWIKHFFDK